MQISKLPAADLGTRTIATSVGAADVQDEPRQPKWGQLNPLPPPPHQMVRFHMLNFFHNIVSKCKNLNIIAAAFQFK